MRIGFGRHREGRAFVSSPRTVFRGSCMAPKRVDPDWIRRAIHMKEAISPIAPLSIGYLSPGWPLDANPNGVVSYIADMVEHLPRMGHQATVVANSVAGEQRDPSIYDMQRVRSRATWHNDWWMGWDIE